MKKIYMTCIDPNLEGRAPVEPPPAWIRHCEMTSLTGVYANPEVEPVARFVRDLISQDQEP